MGCKCPFCLSVKLHKVSDCDLNTELVKYTLKFYITNSGVYFPSLPRLPANVQTYQNPYLPQFANPVYAILGAENPPHFNN